MVWWKVWDLCKTHISSILNASAAKQHSYGLLVDYEIQLVWVLKWKVGRCLTVCYVCQNEFRASGGDDREWALTVTSSSAHSLKSKFRVTTMLKDLTRGSLGERLGSH